MWAVGASRRQHIRGRLLQVIEAVSGLAKRDRPLDPSDAPDVRECVNQKFTLALAQG
jgi:hypothetical protein